MKKLLKKLSVSIIILISVFLTNCSDSSVMDKDQETSFLLQKNDEEINSVNDIALGANHHQIFYGNWVIVSFISGGRFSDPSEADKYIGSFIEFGPEQIRIDGEHVIEYPQYSCIIVNTEERHFFWNYFFPDNDSDVVNIECPYFVYIYLHNKINILNVSENDILYHMNGFYIKDSETLIFDGGFGLLKMERISYPVGYKDWIGGI